MNNMRPLLLLAMLLCMLCVIEVQTQENALKLCGRAFVRAVVYTCGGSRWRRLTGEEILEDSNRGPKLKTTDVPAMSRHLRDQNEELISVCCQLGCRRSDLSMLC